MESSKIQLSKAEWELVQDTNMILTKNRIMKKAGSMLLLLEKEMQGRLAGFPELMTVTPKISRGENYRGLPYMVLDYPRLHDSTGICFIRSMFWWGNFFSSTLQLSGKYIRQHRHRILGAIPELKAQYFAGTGNDPWVHHFEGNDYREAASLQPGEWEMLLEKAYFKLAARWPVAEWDEAPERLLSSWEFLLRLISQSVK